MQIVLKEDIEKLGRRGEVVKVADGYARNYLLPLGKALPATPGNLKIIEREKLRYVARLVKEKGEHEALARKIQALSLTLVRKVGESDVLYGSVTSSDIAEGLEKEGIVVDKRRIAIHVWDAQAINLSQHHRLDDREALCRSIDKVTFGILQSQPMKQLTRRIAQVEKGRPVRVNQKAPVVTHFQHRLSSGVNWAEARAHRWTVPLGHGIQSHSMRTSASVLMVCRRCMPSCGCGIAACPVPSAQDDGLIRFLGQLNPGAVDDRLD